MKKKIVDLLEATVDIDKIGVDCYRYKMNSNQIFFIFIKEKYVDVCHSFTENGKCHKDSYDFTTFYHKLQRCTEEIKNEDL